MNTLDRIHAFVAKAFLLLAVSCIFLACQSDKEAQNDEGTTDSVEEKVISGDEALRSAGHKPAAFFSRLDWLEGKWKIRTDGAEAYEEWKQEDENLWAGESYTIKDGAKQVRETLEIKKDSTGAYYIPTVPDQNEGAAVPFKMILIANKLFMAENPDHDWPNRIMYNFTSEDTLVAIAEGGEGESFRQIQFVMDRVH